jgi:beta-1,4-mannooligosaccharide phosphorylase/Secretion system C-terminal sorting domain
MKLMVLLLALNLSAFWQSAQCQITWQKEATNPVLGFWSGDVNDPNGYKYALDPAPFVDEHGVCHMWFTSCAYGYGTSFCVSEAVSTDLVRWFTYFRNPLLRPGTAGSFDERGVRVMTVLRDSTGYKMYYMGLTNTDHHAIGLATSSNGTTWTKYPGNPVLDSGPPGTWDSVKVSTASVYFDGSNYVMWYTGRSGNNGSIGLATSSDGVHWTKYPGNPILVAGAPGSWEQGSAEGAKVLRVGNLFHMFYGGHDPALDAFHIGYAYSPDGVTWTKYAGNPVLSRGSGTEWDGQSLGLMGAIFKDDKFHLWFSGLGVSSQFPPYWQIGYATSAYTPLNTPPGASFPTRALLLQNYPNPFNPATTINYALPVRTQVTLKIYDLLGAEVATLVNALEEPGYKSVPFDATRFAGGVYFYQLMAGDFTETRKMMLTK